MSIFTYIHLLVLKTFLLGKTKAGFYKIEKSEVLYGNFENNDIETPVFSICAYYIVPLVLSSSFEISFVCLVLSLGGFLLGVVE